jgi:hypothetical protein
VRAAAGLRRGWACEHKDACTVASCTARRHGTPDPRSKCCNMLASMMPARSCGQGDPPTVRAARGISSAMTPPRGRGRGENNDR